MDANRKVYDVIIVGSGPSGLTAGLYTSRGSLSTLVIGGRQWGGQLMLTTEVENYPGFPDGIMGPDLMKAMRKQTEKYGAQILDINFVSADFSPRKDSEQVKKPFEIHSDDEKIYYSKSVIIATGADTKWLGVPGEKEKIGRGISSCAPCDAPFYRDRKVIVVGGGDSAMEEALVLTKFASHITIVHRKDSLRASEVMQKRAFENEKISFIWNSEIVEIPGEMKVEKVKIKTKTTDGNISVSSEKQNEKTSISDLGGTEIEKKDGEAIWEMPIEGVFVSIGHIPNTKVFKGLDLDDRGFMKVYNHTKTNVEGVFVAGDVHDAEYKQAVTAAGFGCMAALEVEKWLNAQDDK